MPSGCVCVMLAIALHDAADAILAVVNTKGSGLDGGVRLTVFWSCSSQNTRLNLRPGFRCHGTGALILRVRRWSPTRGTSVEQTPPIFPQITGGNHDLFTPDDWEKGERSLP